MGKNTKLVFSFMGIAFLFLTGFDLRNPRIPLDEIQSGGPPKDGIPALTNPRSVPLAEAENAFLKKSDRVLGLAIDGHARAYPIKILNWHEIVNDNLGGRPVVVTFCPLCGTGMVFDGEIGHRRFTFGVSGLLYQSDLLLYDRQTESLWSQIKGEAVTGEIAGTKLKLLPSVQTTWAEWKKKYPNSLVLSTQTGHNRDYERDPYADYYESPTTMFRVNNQNSAYHPKEKIIGVEIAGIAKAYPFSELAKTKPLVKDTINGIPVTVRFDKQSQTAIIQDKNGQELATIVGFWFAWIAFHPETEIFRAADR